MINKLCKVLIFSFISFGSTIVFGQCHIRGVILDMDHNPVENAFVGVQSIDDTLTWVQYQYSFIGGGFNIEMPNCGEYLLQIKSLSHKPYEIFVNIGDAGYEVNLEVLLEDKSYEINEVVAVASHPIDVKNDTIVFNAKFFSKGNENTVEDLLRNLPGIRVDSDGTIKVGNNEIEKIMVGGDDFFEKGYKILSKNMPAYPIEEVELLKNYSNNRLLKGIEESNKVALNLKLKKESKRIWFGDIDASAGNHNFYSLKGNLMNYGRKNKYYFLTNLNNIGYDATGDLELIINPLLINEVGSIGDDQRAHRLLSMPEFSLSFDKSRTTSNNDKLFSPNIIINSSDKLKIKLLGVLNRNVEEFLRATTDEVNIGQVSFINNENYNVYKTRDITFGRFELNYQFSPKSDFKAITKYNLEKTDGSTNLVFNGDKTKELMSGSRSFFDQKLCFTHKIRNNKVVLLTGRYKYEIAPQEYSIDRFFYEELFPDLNGANNVSQSSFNEMNYGGLNIYYIHRFKNSNLLELQIADEYRKDDLKTVFTVFNDTVRLNNPNGYQNQLTHEINDFYLRSKYLYQIKQFSLVGRIQLNYISTVLGDKSNSKLILNPAIDFQWKINKKNKLNLTYGYTKTNSEIVDVFNGFVMTDYGSFVRGIGDVEYLGASKVILSYELGNWTDRFFASVFFLYLNNHDSFSTNSFVQQYYSLSEKILIKDREMYSVDTKFDYYMRPVLNNIKLDMRCSINEFKNTVNELSERLVISVNYHIGLELRSAFNGKFNYHLGSKWLTSSIQTTYRSTFTDNVSYADLIFTFSKRGNIKLKFERYEFGSFKVDNEYYFSDFNANYFLISDKLSLGLDVKNLFDTRWFRSYSVSDIGSSTIKYKLLPRYFLLRMEYRF